MPATNVSRYRLASPSATGMQSGLFAVQTVLSPRTQGGTDCVSLPTGFHDEAPFLSHIGEILDLCGQSLRVERQDRFALDVQVRVLQQVRSCLDGKDLPALCSEHLKMMLLKEPG